MKYLRSGIEFLFWCSILLAAVVVIMLSGMALQSNEQGGCPGVEEYE